MKKLLSLLSVLTISGTAIPNIIAASNYEKNDIKDLSELNWTGLNINKNKRDTKNKQTKHIFKTNGAEKPTEQQIKEKIKELNSQLDIKNINVTNITENSAVITIIGFKGQKTIHFKVETNTSNNEPFVSSPNNYSFDITKINNKKILIDKLLDNNDVNLKEYILENDINKELKSKILELLLIDNTNLNEDSFKIEFINQAFPIDIRNKSSIELEVNVIDKKNNKNNAIIKIEFKRPIYINSTITTINSPEKIIAKDVRNVTEEEIKNALLLKIYDKLKKINPGYPKYGTPEYTTIRNFTITGINFPIDLSSEKIINSFNFTIHIYNIFELAGYSPTTVNLKNFKLPAAQLI